MLGQGTAYIDRVGGQYEAYFYSEGDTIRYGTDENYDNLARRLKRQGFTKIVNIAPEYEEQVAHEKQMEKQCPKFFSNLEEDVPKRRIKRRKSK